MVVVDEFVVCMVVIKVFFNVCDLDNVFVFIYVLGDFDDWIVCKVRDVLCFLSCRIDGMGLLDDLFLLVKFVVVECWKEWYLLICLDVLFLN